MTITTTNHPKGRGHLHNSSDLLPIPLLTQLDCRVLGSHGGSHRLSHFHMLSRRSERTRYQGKWRGSDSITATICIHLPIGATGRSEAGRQYCDNSPTGDLLGHRTGKSPGWRAKHHTQNILSSLDLRSPSDPYSHSRINMTTLRPPGRGQG